MTTINMEEVFKIGGVPTYTFVEPIEFNQLVVALRTPGRGVVVEGPSGIGKTTALMRAIEHLCLSEEVLTLSARRSEDISLIGELPFMNDVGTVVIDDFHRLDNDLKQRIADHLKVLADEEATSSKIIILGINQAGQALVEFAHDLNNRLEIIRFEANPDQKVRELISKGESTLQIKLNVAIEIIEASNGSFYIAQMLAHQICVDHGILHSLDSETDVNVSFEFTRSKVFDRLARTFMERAITFCRGTRIRREGRAPYLHLLNWLATSDEWSLAIYKAVRNHPEHRGSIIQVTEKGYLSSLINSHDTISDVLHFDGISMLLTVEDPQFMFFLRNLSWNRFALDVGFESIEFSTPYDFALSFSGEDRDIAEKIFVEMEERETQVFYDKNEQHRILAEDVEDYLRPIYQADASFVIVLLGPSYPKRVWTKFESESFKDRFKENAVIPIWFDEAPPGMFDETARLGGISFSRTRPVEDEVSKIVELCCKKLQESRA